MQLYLCQKSTSKAENGRLSTYDVDVPWPLCRTYPHGDGTSPAGKERVVGKEECGMRVSLARCTGLIQAGVTFGLETQSTRGRGSS
jgi:hypothetical protein